MTSAENEAKLLSDPMSGMDDTSLGEAVRQARKGRGLSLQVVAEGVGISTGLLSQIERGISSPSIRNLREAGIIVREGRRRTVDFGDKGMVKSFLTAHDDGALQVMEIVLDPGGSSGEESYTHEGEECGVVLQGKLELWVEDDRFVLGEGDAFHFESRRPHRFRNLGNDQTRVHWVTTPPVW